MSKHTDRELKLVRCLCGVASLAVTLTIVLWLDGLSDHYSAATVAKAPSTVVVASGR